MFKLIATVLMLSDTGSVATSMMATNIPVGEQCEAIKRDFFTDNTTVIMGGHKVVIKIKGECIPLDSETESVPPIVNNLLRGLRLSPEWRDNH